MDLVKTINSDDEIENYSEESDGEHQFQPSKRKKKTEFNEDFEFFDSVEDYNKDPWNDLQKYIKRKASTKTDDKIEKFRKKRKLDDDKVDEIQDDDEEDLDNSYDSDVSLSSEDLQHDHIKIKDKRKKKSKEIDIPVGEDMYTYDEDLSFQQMHLSRPLMKAIGQMQFTHPTPIQAATVPVALLGKDIYGCAATGTGKTAAYMLPTIERLIFRPSSGLAVTRVLVLVPTRELGVQVYQVTSQLCQFTDIQVGLSVGGLDLKVQESVLRKNPDIVIATPGRLIDHLQSTPTFGLESVEILILDEADRMLDEYFAEQMKQIISQCARTRQTMLFSATMNEEVNDLAMVSLKEPTRIFVDSNKVVAANLRQEFIRIRHNNNKQREAILAALVCRTFRDNCIIFVPTKVQAHRVHILLGLLGVKIAELHGNLTQPQRLDTLQKFKTNQVDVVVATDVAARGLDIPGVKTVINFTLPRTYEHYIHRVGRTARAGRAGISISLAGDQERKIVKEVIKNSEKKVKSRIIPLEIIQKYVEKLETLEPKIIEILNEEKEERMMSMMEKQLNRTERLIKGEVEVQRPWFQTKQERKDEKQRLENKAGDLKKQINEKLGKGGKMDKDQKLGKDGKTSKGGKMDKDKKLGKGGKKDGAKKGEKAKINPSDRIAKQKEKKKKIRTCQDFTPSFGAASSKKRSNFKDDKSSGNNNFKARTGKSPKSNKGGKGKGKPKKSFGKPKLSKKF